MLSLFVWIDKGPLGVLYKEMLSLLVWIDKGLWTSGNVSMSVRTGVG
jgi:hypothetical protein